MGKVRVGVGRRRYGVVEGIALAGDGLRAVARDVGHESRLAEAGLFVLGCCGAAALVGNLAVVIVAVYPEEVLDALRNVAVGAIELLVGGQGGAREGALLGHVGVGGCGGAEELRHTSDAEQEQPR